MREKLVRSGRLKYDLFFKKIFHEKHLVKAFLNTVLEPDLDSPVEELSFEPTDFIISGKPTAIQSVKHDVIDVFCVTAQGTRVLVELQKGRDKRALARFLDYQCRNYSNQFAAGADYSTVMPCYSICWFFDMKPPHKRVRESLRITSDCRKTDWNFPWEIIALYPKNISRKLIEQKQINKLEEWLLLDVTEDIQDSTKIRSAIRTREVSEAFELLDLSGLSEDQLRRMFFEEHIVQEYPDLLQEKLREKVFREKFEMAKGMLRDGLPVDTVVKYTGLSLDDIELLNDTE